MPKTFTCKSSWCSVLICTAWMVETKDDDRRKYIHCDMYFKTQNVWINGMIMSNQCLHAVYVMWVDYWTFWELQLRIFGLLHEINWKCLSTHMNTTVTHCNNCHESTCMFVYGMGMSVKLCKRFWLFMYMYHYTYINLTIQAVVRGDYILILLLS